MGQRKPISISRLGPAGAVARYSLTLAMTGASLYASSVFRNALGSAGLYLPPLLAVLISTACAGIWPALVSQLVTSATIFLFIAHPLQSPIRAVDLYSLILFLIIGTLVLWFARKFQWAAHGRPGREDFEMIARATHDSLWEWDLKSDQVWRTGNLQGIFGLDMSEFVSGIGWWRERLHPDDASRVWSSLWRAIEGSESRWAEEYRIRQQSGVYIPVADRGFVVRNRSGKPVLMVGGMIDISARRRVEEKLAHQAFHDSLTGLPNRDAFLERLEHAASASESGPRHRLGVLVVDVDRFKIVNESLGHQVGDELLARVAASLRECLRPGDMAARFAGDEFAVLLDGIDSITEARQIAKGIQISISNPIAIRGHDIVITVSIGIALVDFHKPEAAVRHAGVAMHRAKSGGKARFEVFEPSVDTRAMAQLQLETDLRQGIQQDAFQVHYQPIISLRTGELASFEALLRWHHPQRGILLPGQFLPVAEEAGLVLSLGQLALRQACKQLQAWRSKGLASSLRLNVNMSGKEFADPLVADIFRQTIAGTQLGGDALVIELTESIIMEDRQLALEKLGLLRELGIELAVDDFGTGYSALARLQDFPISSLKADASFVTGISEGKPEIFDAIVALAHELNLEVTAEGVETAGQLDYLRRSGAAYGQGLFLSDVLSPAQAEALLVNDPPWKAIFEQPVEAKPRKRVAVSVSG